MTGGYDDSVRIWDSASARLLATLTGLSPRFASFIANDSLLLASSGVRARTWNVGLLEADPETVARLVECRVAWRVVGGQLRESLPKCGGS